MASQGEAQLQVEVPEVADLEEVLLRLVAHAAAEEAKVERTAEVPSPEVPESFRQPGELVFLIGTIQGDARGSAYLAVTHGLDVRGPPPLDPARLAVVEEVVRRGVEEGLLSSVRRCGVGGLAVALARCCLEVGAAGEEAPRQGFGAALRIPFPARKDLVLFSEEGGRAVVALPPASAARFEALARETGAPAIALGAVGGDRLEIQAAVSVGVEELVRAWRRELSEPAQEAPPPAPGSPPPARA